MNKDTIDTLWIFYSLVSCISLAYIMGLADDLREDEPIATVIAIIIAIGCGIRLFEVFAC